MKTNEESEDIFKSFAYAEKTTDTPSLRVMSLHSLMYCQRLFYLEEVEGIMLADANVYDGRRIHENLDKGSKCYTLELASENLKLRGKVDCARRESGELIIHEYKRGKSKDNGQAWEIDITQVLAYALLLTEHTKENVNKARIHYLGDKKKIDIDIDISKARKKIETLISLAQELRSSTIRPPVTEKSYLCSKCSLAPACLPEETRFAERKERQKPKRLFPLEDYKRVIHLVKQGTYIKKRGEQFLIQTPEGENVNVPSHSVSSFVLHGNIQVSSQVIRFCVSQEIGIYWLSVGGFYVTSLCANGNNVQRKNRLYCAIQNNYLRLSICLQIVTAKVDNQLKYILRATRSRETRSKSVNEKITQIRNCLQSVKKLREECQSDTKFTDEDVKLYIDSLRGYEGMAGKNYFQILPEVLRLKKHDFLYFDGRNRRPPKDPFNALLSFGYALLYKDCVSAILAVGLEPALGFFHTPRSTAYPLALDLMEIFRTILWDIPLIASVNRKQWSPDDFDITPKQVWLNFEGRRKAIQIYESRKQEKWKHPVLDYSLTYSRTLELEARLLEKEWSDGESEAGLFGKIRLR